MRILATLLVLAACGDNRQVPDASVADAPAETIDTPAELQFLDGPAFSFPAINAPLSGRLELTTNRPTRVSLRVTSAARSFSIERTTLATSHAIPVLELRADTLHQLVVTATDADGVAIIADPIDALAPGVPTFTPVLTATQLVPGQIEPGVTLAAMNTFVMAIDLTGAYVWFVDLERRVVDVTLLPTGNFLVLFDDRIGAAEIDPYGTILASWQAVNRVALAGGATPVAVDSFHHELSYLPSGDLLTLSSERRVFANYPTSETDPTPRATPVGVVGDVVAVFGPDGTVRAAHSLLDALDPYRIAYGSFGAFWSMFYQPPAGSLDWSHGNAVVLDPSDNGFITSLRHQDALVKLDAAGDLQWILGTHDNWSAAFTPFLLTPVGTPFAFPFHQHAPLVLANGNLLVFDNGNLRVSPPAAPPPTSFSRAVEYAVDPVAKQVRQVWEYAPSPAIFAAATGDVDVGATTGNVIVTFGTASEIVEVTHATPPIEVFRMRPTAGFTFYRSERVPSLYP